MSRKDKSKIKVREKNYEEFRTAPPAPDSGLKYRKPGILSTRDIVTERRLTPDGAAY